MVRKTLCKETKTQRLLVPGHENVIMNNIVYSCQEEEEEEEEEEGEERREKTKKVKKRKR